MEGGDVEKKSRLEPDGRRTFSTALATARTKGMNSKRILRQSLGRPPRGGPAGGPSAWENLW